MTDQRPDGLYECPDCHSTYDAEIALMWCCRERDHTRGYD